MFIYIIIIEIVVFVNSLGIMTEQSFQRYYFKNIYKYISIQENGFVGY